MAAGDEFRTHRMRQQLLEARRERLVVEDLVLPSPDQQCREFRFLELSLEPFKTPEAACGVIEWNPARPGPGEKPRSRIWQDALVNALRFISESLPVDHRQVHSATGQRIVLTEKIRADKGRVHHAPGKYSSVEFSRGKRPGPGTHDHERTDAVRVGEGKTETSRAAPIMTDHGRVADVELAQQAREILDVAVETARLVADPLFGEAQADHSREDPAPACSPQQ